MKRDIVTPIATS